MRVHNIEMYLLFVRLMLFQVLRVGVIVVDCQQVAVVFHKRFVPKGEVHVVFLYVLDVGICVMLLKRSLVSIIPLFVSYNFILN